MTSAGTSSGGRLQLSQRKNFLTMEAVCRWNEGNEEEVPFAEVALVFSPAGA